MPLEAPVTNAVFPFKSMFISSFLGGDARAHHLVGTHQRTSDANHPRQLRLDIGLIDNSRLHDVEVLAAIANVRLPGSEHVSCPAGVLSERQPEPEPITAGEAGHRRGVDPARLVTAMV